MARTRSNFSSSFLLKGEREFQRQHRADETYIPPLHSKRLVIPVLFGTLHVHICIYTGLRHHARPAHRFSDLLRQICLRLQIVITTFGFCDSPPPTSSCSSSYFFFFFFFFFFFLPCQRLRSCRKAKLSIYTSRQSNTGGKTRGFYYSRQLQA